MEKVTTIPPAEVVISAFKSVSAAARLLGRDRCNIYKWRKTGEVPAAAHRKILEKSQELGLGLTIEDLYYGRKKHA